MHTKADAILYARTQLAPGRHTVFSTDTGVTWLVASNSRNVPEGALKECVDTRDQQLIRAERRGRPKKPRVATTRPKGQITPDTLKKIGRYLGKDSISQAEGKQFFAETKDIPQATLAKALGVCASCVYLNRKGIGAKSVGPGRPRGQRKLYTGYDSAGVQQKMSYPEWRAHEKPRVAKGLYYQMFLSRLTRMTVLEALTTPIKQYKARQIGRERSVTHGE